VMTNRLSQQKSLHRVWSRHRDRQPPSTEVRWTGGMARLMHSCEDADVGHGRYQYLMPVYVTGHKSPRDGDGSDLTRLVSVETSIFFGRMLHRRISLTKMERSECHATPSPLPAGVVCNRAVEKRPHGPSFDLHPESILGLYALLLIRSLAYTLSCLYALSGRVSLPSFDLYPE
jgi:hypothetical protein